MTVRISFQILRLIIAKAAASAPQPRIEHALASLRVPLSKASVCSKYSKSRSIASSISASVRPGALRAAAGETAATGSSSRTGGISDRLLPPLPPKRAPKRSSFISRHWSPSRMSLSLRPRTSILRSKP